MAGEWEAFLDRVEQARDDLGSPDIVWYRGHSDEQWSLIPSLMRMPASPDIEQALFHEFKRSATRLFDRRYSDWEILFDMQHYGVPTRLLDWSGGTGRTA